MLRIERSTEPYTSPDAPGRPWLFLAFALGTGLAGGALTSFAQSVLQGGWAGLANSGSAWVMVAFLFGLRLPGRWRTAAVAGVLTQIGLVVGYYATAELRGYPAGTAAVVIWIITGMVAGPAYGAAGALLGDHRRPTRAAAAGITGSVWVVEGLHLLWLATDANSNSGPGATAGCSYIVIAVLLPLALARSMRDRAYALLALTVFAGAAAVAGLLIESAFAL